MPGEGNRFKPGQSGNWAGRPIGSGKVAQLRAAIEDHVPAVIEAMVEAAKNGDTNAARLLLERTIPSLKVSSSTPLPSLAEAKSLPDLLAAIMQSLSNGDLDPQSAACLLSSLSKLRQDAPRPPEMRIEDIDKQLKLLLKDWRDQEQVED